MSRKRKISKKYIYLIFILIIAVISAFGYGNADKVSDEKPFTSTESQETQAYFQVHYIDVGQGDSTLIISGDKSLLIDAGENGHETDVINYLRSHNIEKLDYIIVTHQHSDHIGGIPEVLEEFDTDNIIMPRLTEAQTPTNSTYTEFLKALKAADAKIISSKVGATYTLGDASFEILGPVTNDAENINSMSVVTKFTYGENTFLFTGDGESDEENEIIETGADLDCDIYKVGHHGSKTSSSKAFLDAVTPEICVISCGADNDYGHPHDVVTKRIAKYTDEVYRTDICGDIVITSDGANLDVIYGNQ